MPRTSAMATSACLAVAMAALPTLAHEGEAGEPAPASVAGQSKPQAPGKESYIQKHMASEHHIGAFDMGSFFKLHDLDRNGVWDRSEIEAIYGVHHSTSVKHSPSYEVHDDKANKIVRDVLRRIDKDNDGMITKKEFIDRGIDGLPSFEEYGKGVLGHHYDEESEYFVHHEEIYHKNPEDQTKESYNHPEDIAHFAHHDKIEEEEERRERAAEGMPSIEEDERRRKIAQSKGEKYVSPYEAQLPRDDSPAAPQHAFDAHAEHPYAQEQSQYTEHVFKTPEGEHVVKSAPVRADPDAVVQPQSKDKAAKDAKAGDAKENASNAQAAAEPSDPHVPTRMRGETDEGFKDRLTAYENAKKAEAAYAAYNPDLASPGIDPQTGEAKRMPGESFDDFSRRKARLRFEAAQRSQPYKPAKMDELRKSAPYKYPPIQTRLKKSSFFGEF